MASRFAQFINSPTGMNFTYVFISPNLFEQISWWFFLTITAHKRIECFWCSISHIFIIVNYIFYILISSPSIFCLTIWCCLLMDDLWWFLGPKTTHFWGPVANWGFVLAVIWTFVLIYSYINVSYFVHVFLIVSTGFWRL